MDTPKNVMNPRLYKKAKDIANDKYGKGTSLYKSAFLVKTYKDMGGKYSEEKKVKKVDKWFSQKWVDMDAYIKGKVVECGRSRSDKDSRKFPLCRPLHKKGEKILTASEVLKSLGKEKIQEMISKKRKNPNLRANWSKGTVS